MRKLAIGALLVLALTACGRTNRVNIDLQKGMDCVDRDLTFDVLGWDDDASLDHDVRIPTVVRNHPVCQAIQAEPTPYVSD